MVIIQGDLREFGNAGLGIIYDSWDTYYADARTTARYQSPDGLVECSKDRLLAPQCWLRAHPPGTRAQQGPVAAMQRAADALLNMIPAYRLENAELRVVVPTPDGGTAERIETMPRVPENPIYMEGGRRYDGVIGPRSGGWIRVAAILAGALKAPPDNAVTALATPARLDLITMQADGIAAYFNDVTAHFQALLDAYRKRGMKPAATPLAPETITQIIIKEVEKKSKFPLGAAIAIGLGVLGLIGGAVYLARDRGRGAAEPTPAGRRRVTRRQFAHA